MEQEILKALLACIEKHPKGSENKEWFIKLIQDSLNGNTNSETNEDLIYNATVVENILANLLAVDIKTIIKIRLLYKIINTVWEENNWDVNFLNSYIFEEKSTSRDTQDISQENSEVLNISQNTGNNQTTIEELPSLEIEMINNEENTPVMTNTTVIESQSTSQLSINPELLDENVPMDLIGKDITKVLHYDIRNRKFDPTNPYYITNNKTYRLGALAAIVPGDTNKERKSFIARCLKMPPNSRLIQFVFWNGNSWITIGFNYEENLLFCKNKLNVKEK